MCVWHCSSLNIYIYTFDGIQQVRLIAGDSGLCCVCDIVQVLVNVLMIFLCVLINVLMSSLCVLMNVLMSSLCVLINVLMSSLCVLINVLMSSLCVLMNVLMSSLCVLINVLMSSLCVLMNVLMSSLCVLINVLMSSLCVLINVLMSSLCGLSCYGVVNVSEFVGGGPDPARLRKRQAQVHLWLLPLLLLLPQGKIRWVRQCSYDCRFSWWHGFGE